MMATGDDGGELFPNRTCSVCGVRPEDKFTIIMDRASETWEVGPGICNPCYVQWNEQMGTDDDPQLLPAAGMPIVGGGVAHVFTAAVPGARERFERMSAKQRKRSGADAE